jgi:hypothetical protein
VTNSVLVDTDGHIERNHDDIVLFGSLRNARFKDSDSQVEIWKGSSVWIGNDRVALSFEFNGFSYCACLCAQKADLVLLVTNTVYIEVIILVSLTWSHRKRRCIAIVVVQRSELIGDRDIDKERHAELVSLIVFYYDDIVLGCIGIHDVNIKEDNRASWYPNISVYFVAHLVELNGFSYFVYLKARENELISKAFNCTLILYNEVIKIVGVETW